MDQKSDTLDTRFEAFVTDPKIVNTAVGDNHNAHIS